MVEPLFDPMTILLFTQLEDRDNGSVGLDNQNTKIKFSILNFTENCLN